MDLITIIWYFSTFLLLILFFVVMVCSDNVCNRERNKPEDIPVTAPPTPAPSYREFAPPGYDTVMKKYKNRIFIVPMENSNEAGIFSAMEPPPPLTLPPTIGSSPVSSSLSSPVGGRAAEVQLHTRRSVNNSSSLSNEVIVELSVLNERPRISSTSNDINSISVVREELEEQDEGVGEEVTANKTSECVNVVVVSQTVNEMKKQKAEDDSRSVSG